MFTHFAVLSPSIFTYVQARGTRCLFSKCSITSSSSFFLPSSLFYHFTSFFLHKIITTWPLVQISKIEMNPAPAAATCIHALFILWIQNLFQFLFYSVRLFLIKWSGWAWREREKANVHIPNDGVIKLEWYEWGWEDLCVDKVSKLYIIFHQYYYCPYFTTSFSMAIIAGVVGKNLPSSCTLYTQPSCLPLKYWWYLMMTRRDAGWALHELAHSLSPPIVFEREKSSYE